MAKLTNWNIKEDYDLWWKSQYTLIKKSKSLCGNNLTYKLEFYHFGSKVDFYLNDELYTSTDGELLLNPEVFRLSHDEFFWRKLLKYSKRSN